MPKITVDPEVLEKKAGEISRLSERLSKLTGKISNVCLLAGSHDGQFKPRVVQLAGQMNSKIMQSSTRASQSGKKLASISKDFKDADNASGYKKEYYLPPWLDILFQFTNYPGGKTTLFLGGLFGLKTEDISKASRILYTSITRVWKRDISTSFANFDIAKEMRYFKKTKTGREIVEKAKKHGVLFVLYDEDGKVIEKIGDEKSKILIPISWVTVEKDSRMEGNIGFYSPSDKAIFLNSALVGRAGTIMETLIHEMQHGIDFNRADIPEFMTETDKLFEQSRPPDTPLTNEEITIIENEFAEAFEYYVDSEIKAHSLGYEHGGDIEGTIYGLKLNRHDGINTITEKKFILETRQYAINSYEKWVNSFLDKTFQSGPKYTSKVYLNNQGKIIVKITKTNPVVES